MYDRRVFLQRLGLTAGALALPGLLHARSGAGALRRLVALSRVGGPGLPLVRDVELQPLLAQVRRLLAALDYLGTPLLAADQHTLDVAGGRSNTVEAVEAIQGVLDRYCLVGVTLPPGSPPIVALGPAQPELVQGGWRPFLVKVHNAAGVNAALRGTSEQARPLADSPPDEIASRWLNLMMFDSQPLTETLSGLALEYRIVQLYSRDAGRRGARLAFELLGIKRWLSRPPGTPEDWRSNEVPILFDCRSAQLVRWNLRDETGKPTLAAFVIRDAQGRIYPPQSKRLAPDSAFHPQVYRGEGELLTLPAGAYTVEFSRGPESRSKTSMLSVAETAAGGPLQEATFQVERWIDPANFDWWSGDHHIHGAGCAHYTRPTDGVAPQDMLRQTRGEDLKVGAVLVWGQGFDYQAQFFTGQDDPVSQPLYRVHYDVEVSGFGSHFSGHLILLGLRELIPPGAGSYEGWPTLCLNTLRWAKRQGAVCGPAHSGWGLGVESTDLPNYLLPPFDGIGANEYIVDVTHEVPGPDGTLTPAVDFLGVADSSIVSELNIWYHTLNVGFRTRIGGETDFPCGSSDRVGMGRSYVKLDGRLDYAVWCVGLRRGRAYVSDGKSHLLEFRVNDVALGEHGSEVRLAQPGTVRVHVKASALLPAAPTPSPTRPDYFWDLERARVGESRGVSVEIVVNGFPVATQALVADGTMRDLTFDVPIARSSWLAVRILHSSHTNPIWVLVGGSPVRASRRSAEWCLRGVDQCWSQKERFIAAAELDQAGTDYEHARQTYRRLLAECDVD